MMRSQSPSDGRAASLALNSFSSTEFLPTMRRTVPVTATVLDSGPERNALFAAMVAKMPGFADYEARTDRIIPVVRLSPR